MDSTYSDKLGKGGRGPAAILLVESLIHGLIARSVISAAEAVEIVEVAADANEELATAQGQSPSDLSESAALLAAIADSLRPDIPDH